MFNIWLAHTWVPWKTRGPLDSVGAALQSAFHKQALTWSWHVLPVAFQESTGSGLQKLSLRPEGSCSPKDSQLCSSLSSSNCYCLSTLGNVLNFTWTCKVEWHAGPHVSKKVLGRTLLSSLTLCKDLGIKGSITGNRLHLFFMIIYFSLGRS